MRNPSSWNQHYAACVVVLHKFQIRMSIICLRSAENHQLIEMFIFIIPSSKESIKIICLTSLDSISMFWCTRTRTFKPKLLSWARFCVNSMEFAAEIQISLKTTRFWARLLPFSRKWPQTMRRHQRAHVQHQLQFNGSIVETDILTRNSAHYVRVLCQHRRSWACGCREALQTHAGRMRRLIAQLALIAPQPHAVSSKITLFMSC